MCTTSLTRFDYIDLGLTNLTLKNTSVLAGPIAGGTRISFGGNDAFREGLPDFGRPTCFFGDELTTPARLSGARELRYQR